MIKRINSHPHLFLSEHIEQINEALRGIQGRHTQKTITPRVKGIMEKLAFLHDLGKGTSAFQEYIANPQNYKGDAEEKSHSALSLLFALVKAQNEGWDELETLVLAAVAKGHHSRLPTIPEKKIGVGSSQWDLDGFAGGEKARLLKKQLGMVNYDDLAEETGIDLEKYLKSTNAFDNSTRFLAVLKKFVINRIAAKLFSLSDEKAVNFRLRAQLVFSMFLEADKAFLAVSNPGRYLNREVRHWQPQWIDQYIGEPDDTATNRLRHKARGEIINAIRRNETERIFSLTAPTGSGKTLLAATWAFKLREITSAAPEIPPKIIVVLPFLSVIDQTSREYENILKTGGYIADGTWLLNSHSLADRNYADCLEDEDKPFFVDTWRSELIITTYDQFLMSLMDPRTRYQMRFHNLCDALIIM
ncbi:MAG TPA: CRISPR-associated endonuclease Cas3'', partial [Desulfotomaculum sp.]|nr:CRISPR-associated endonuclease Cas3'' [Desulfotomaculum sp.]